MSDKPQPENGADKGAGKGAGSEDDLKRKLVRRVAFAGILIALLLVALAFIDYLGQPADETAPSEPTYTSPVPVPKKEVTQPVKPAEPAPPEPTKEEAPPPPPVAETPTAAPPAVQAPARPDGAARPALSRPEARAPQAARLPRPAAVATPAEGTAAASSPVVPVPEKPVAPPVERPQAAPPRLFTGYAVQAGVFADVQHAEELRAKLTLNGIPSTIEARVQVGPFKTRAEAEAAQQKLKALGIEGLLLPPPKAARR